MQKKSLKVAAMAAIAGTVCQFGCLGDGLVGWLLREAAIDSALDFVLDNDTVFDLFEVLLQVRRVDGEVRDVVLVKEFDLIVDIVRALVARRGGEQADLFAAFGQVVLEHLVPLRTVVAEIVAFVDEHKVAVLVFDVIEDAHGAMFAA